MVANAPTDDAEEPIKEAFYDLLDGACPEYDVKIERWDFNTKHGNRHINCSERAPEQMVRRTGVYTEDTIFYKLIQLQGYGYDIDIID